MVHFYRAAPQQPKNDMQEYLMYGLLAVALILGVVYFYRRHKQKKEKENKDMENKDKNPATASPSASPSAIPSASPSAMPSASPSVTPSATPTRRV